MNYKLVTLSVAVLSLAAVSAQADGVVKAMDNSKFATSAASHSDILGKETLDRDTRKISKKSQGIVDLNSIEPAAGSPDFTMPNSGIGESVKR